MAARRHGNQAVMIGVGAAFDHHAGTTKRAVVDAKSWARMAAWHGLRAWPARWALFANLFD
jgi:UDP-N-acetyl-D-mannosaminuronic acid transferase (WecB/TagA/CpsF family)